MDKMKANTTASPGPQLWTIGHSTKPIEEFLALLKAHGVQRLVDVRTIPRSRHNPQYDTEALATHLRKATLTYLHMPHLGGLKKPKKDSVNMGWKNTSFRGYADYMQTGQFQSALEELMAESCREPTAVMCAEAVPWRCHRSLIADALLIRGWAVRHIMTKSKADAHRLTRFAVVAGDLLTYPLTSAAS
jgi:uncharacterized protein (DUF488 family)